ncbi:MAG: DsbA family protein [Rhodomicrobium sp.]
MQNHQMKIGLAAVTFSVLSLVAAGVSGTFTAAAQTDSLSEAQVKSFEKVIRDYLLNNPEFLLEVQRAYEAKIAAHLVQATQLRLPAFYKTLASMKSELAGLSVGSGDVTVVEFFDYNCGYCRKTFPDLVKLIENDHNVKVQFMEYPILAPGSREASKVAIAASKQGKYYEFHKAMFASGRASKDSALKVAEQLGLDMGRLKADMAASETDALILKISEAAKLILVNGTPSFVVGDKTNPGWMQYDQLKKLVGDARKDGCKACAEANAVKDEKKS